MNRIIEFPKSLFTLHLQILLNEGCRIVHACSDVDRSLANMGLALDVSNCDLAYIRFELPKERL